MDQSMTTLQSFKANKKVNFQTKDSKNNTMYMERFRRIKINKVKNCVEVMGTLTWAISQKLKNSFNVESFNDCQLCFNTNPVGKLTLKCHDMLVMYCLKKQAALFYRV